MTSKFIFLALISALLFAACDDNASSEDNTPTPDNMGDDMPQAPEDMTMSQPDTAPQPDPLRSLVEAPLFGTTSPGNRMRDPLLTQASFATAGGFPSWFAQTGVGQFAGSQRFITPTSPTGLPSLRVAGNARGIIVTGQGMGGQGPLNASVWVGRDSEGDGGTSMSTLTASVTGYNLDTNEAGAVIDLTLVPDSTQVHGDITWVQFAGPIDDIIGELFLFIEDGSDTNLYVQGAVIERDTTRSLRRVAPTPRGLNTLERMAIKNIIDWRRDQAPPKRPVVFP